MKKLNYAVSGERRKQMVQAIAAVLDTKSEYQRMPSCAYTIGDFMVDKDGALSWADETSEETIKLVVDNLAKCDFAAQEPVEEATPSEVKIETPNKLTIELPIESLPETAIANFDALLAGKGNLIKKAVGTDSLEYQIAEGKILFPWFTLSGDENEALAYAQLISKLAEQARTAKRVSMKEKTVENEKYAFRCFLLRLGFIGDEYKVARKVLLKNLEGNGARK